MALSVLSPFQAEVVDFKFPIGNNKTLFVCNILPRESEAAIYDCIFKVFSEFGLLYFVRLCRNAAVAEPGYYAVVKFYSAVDASSALNGTNKQCLFQEVPLKVQMCTKQRSMKVFHEHQLSLSSIKCQELANYYLGFSGWSSRIIALQNIFDSDGCEENPREMIQPEKKNIKYLCIMEVKFINCGMCSRGIGVSEEFDQDATGNGKVSVQWSLEQDETDCFTEEELQTQLQVNDISWSQFEHEGQEEILSDLSLNTETIEGIET
uniref:RAD52 motif-containing protein 1 isoform X2 n=1 Tax=Pristiophorus japonicus TaxID=55135 RepID=UPI00398F5E3B